MQRDNSAVFKLFVEAGIESESLTKHLNSFGRPYCISPGITRGFSEGRCQQPSVKSTAFKLEVAVFLSNENVPRVQAPPAAVHHHEVTGEPGRKEMAIRWC